MWGDRRKHNIEHNIPLTPGQQRQQDRIEARAPTLAEKPIPNPTLDRDNDQPRLSLKL